MRSVRLDPRAVVCIVATSIGAGVLSIGPSVRAADESSGPPPNAVTPVGTPDSPAADAPSNAAPPNVVAGEPGPQQPAAAEPQAEGFSSPLGPISTVLGVRAGPAFALGGGLKASRFTGGGWIDARAGLHTQWGLTLALEGSAFYTTGNGLEVTDYAVGGLLRFTFLEQSAVHPWIEARVNLGWLSVVEGSTFEREVTGVRFGTGGALGVELDLTRHFSLEVGVRADALFDQHVWNATIRGTIANVGGPDVLITPVVGGTFYGF